MALGVQAMIGVAPLERTLPPPLVTAPSVMRTTVRSMPPIETVLWVAVAAKAVVFLVLM